MAGVCISRVRLITVLVLLSLVVLMVIKQVKYHNYPQVCHLLKYLPPLPANQNKITCDTECRRLRELQRSWPISKPKAAIYYLVLYSRLGKLMSSLRALDVNFNNHCHYPIILFYDEEQMGNSSVQEMIRSGTNSDLYFQRVTFQTPPFISVDSIKLFSCSEFPVGYRHMCRFHAKLVYEEAVTIGFEYLWRLDDDSLITRAITYDVFVLMRNQSFLYGYITIRDDEPKCIKGLWKAADDYVGTLENNRCSLWQKVRVEGQMYYNNFEISAQSVWRSAEYQAYIQFSDQCGGIYYNRWGDAPIKTIAVALFVPPEKRHHFKDIGYYHKYQVQ